MVPFRDNGHLTRQQRKFNARLSSTRVLIENTYSRLKNLFRRLKFLEIYELQYIKYYIITCCVLHNISINDNVELEEDVNEEPEENEAYEEENHDPINHEASQRRLDIMQNLR